MIFLTLQSDYFDIHYTNDDLSYIQEMTAFLREKLPNIMNFFDIKQFDSNDTLQIYLYNDYEQFIKDCTIDGFVPPSYTAAKFERMHGINIIRALNLTEQKVVKKDSDLIKLEYRILHECVHAFHRIKIRMPLTKGSTLWFVEGLAVTVSHQYDDIPLESTCILEDIILNKANYNTYRTLVTYLLQEYGQDFLLSILDKKEIQEELLPTLCNAINRQKTFKK